jgi:RND family efflux transporter MFP subunit
VAAQQQAQADVAAGKAAVQTAQINWGHTSVTAPIAGRIGRALVTEGALVGQGESTPLAVIQQIQPVYVNFTQSAAEVMKLRRALESGQLQRAAGKEAASVRVVLEDGSEYPLPGKLLFSDLTVDASTGQITLRAEVPNPKGELLPGLYVRVRLEQAQVSDAISIPQQAVTRTQQGDKVTIVTRRWQIGAAHGQGGHSTQQPMDCLRRLASGRAGDGRWLPETANAATGHPCQGGAVASTGQQRLHTSYPSCPSCKHGQGR